MTNDIVIKTLSKISSAAGYLDSIEQCSNEYSLEKARGKIDEAITEITCFYNNTSSDDKYSSI
jgi:hypothetical protein